MNEHSKAEILAIVQMNSAKTSINQIPALFKKIPWQWGQMNLDIGGGKFDKATEYLASTYGVNNFVYDPYNRTPEHNKRILDYKIEYDSATLANVLNVIMSEAEKILALKLAQTMVKPGGKIYISVYEGNWSNEPSISSKGTWQENRKLRSYLSPIHRVWDPKYVKIRRNMIEVTNGERETPIKLCPSCMLLPNA